MIGRFSVAPSDHEVQRVNAAINEEEADVLDNNNQKGEMAGGAEYPDLGSRTSLIPLLAHACPAPADPVAC